VKRGSENVANVISSLNGLATSSGHARVSPTGLASQTKTKFFPTTSKNADFNSHSKIKISGSFNFGCSTKIEGGGETRKPDIHGQFLDQQMPELAVVVGSAKTIKSTKQSQ
jgi:hypothetical protein